jgi:hypothetical protein
MKYFSLLLFFVLFLASCELFDKPKDSSTTLEGDTDIPLNSVGNEATCTVLVNGKYIDVNESMVITKNDDGVITATLKATLPPSPLTDLIPAELKDSKGNLSCETKYKCTSEGILDYTNAGRKPFVLVKYDAKVGDKYILEKDDGTTITRTVTAKSTTDDYPYGLMMIKTIEVEQDSRIPGVKKIIYHTNHKFGLVSVETLMEDGTSSKIYLYPTNY